MAPASNLKTSSRFRVKKLSRQTQLSIHREDQIDSTEYESLQNEKVDTGVEKAEEKEYHLQAALASTSGGAVEEIPAPPTEESADVDYEKLYPLVFKKPTSYIRFSQTVEECTGCQYDMTTEDDVFLKAFNQKKSGAKCSENDFEQIMEAFEETASEQAPFASVDNTVISFEAMQLALKQQIIPPKVQLFAKDIYEHWKARRLAAGNSQLQPSLKFEKNQELDDGDPYVCFRRRDARQTRKTRNRDVQSTEKLKRLRKELEDGRELIKLAYDREVLKRQNLKNDKEIFESRAKTKDIKVKLGIKTADDDDLLINQRPQKRKHTDFPAPRPAVPPMRLPGRSDGRALDADLILLSDIYAQRESMLQAEIEEKAEQHRKWNLKHVDVTREPLPPVAGPEASFRPATAQTHYLITPPSSVTSESFDHGSPTFEKPENYFHFTSPMHEEEHPRQSAYRRRVGRGGRRWIDRKGMRADLRTFDEDIADRFKYDQDDDDEQPVFWYDPHDTKSLKFRSTIPLPPTLNSQRGLVGQVPRPNPNSPNNSRPAGAPQAAPAQATRQA